MKTYKVTFMGKPKGDKGPEYSIVRVVPAASIWQALVELHKTYEGIHFPKYELI